MLQFIAPENYPGGQGRTPSNLTMNQHKIIQKKIEKAKERREKRRFTNRLILISLMVKLDTSNILILVRIFDKNLQFIFEITVFIKQYN